MKTKLKCPACGKPWTKHHGIALTCAKMKATRGALLAIRAFCNRILKEIK